jgi:hypothetical protein
MTPEQEARYALNYGLSRSGLSMGAQLAYDRLKEQRNAGKPMVVEEPRAPRRSSPETRAAIAGIFKTGNGKYARPFQGAGMAGISLLGGDWDEYSQVVLQVAILDTLLSIEEKLTALGGTEAAPGSHDPSGAYAPQHTVGVPGSSQP